MKDTRKTPRVSVIVPCYNTAKYVAATLESIFAQTFRDYEVVVVNDGSPDTPELEGALLPWNNRIVYVKTENHGLAGARNNGIRASKGEFIALLDSDDMWEPNYLEVQVRELDENPSADIVYPRARVFGGGEGSGAVSTASRGEVTFISLIEETISVNVSALARRSAFERVGLFDSSLRSCEDFDMWLRCVKNGSRIIYHNEVLLHYRRRSDSLSADRVWMCANAVKVLMKMRTAVQLTAEEREVLERVIRRFEGKKLFFEGKRAFISGDIPSAVECFRRASTYLHNTRLRVILLLLRTMPRTLRIVYLWVLRQRELSSGNGKTTVALVLQFLPCLLGFLLRANIVGH